jgi:hypothetical protein
MSEPRGPVPKKLRFEDGPYYVGHLESQILVGCPRCDSMARVYADSGRFFPKVEPRQRGRVVCEHCGLSRTSDESTWLGPAQGIARQRCGECGRWPTVGSRRERERVDARHRFAVRVVERLPRRRLRGGRMRPPIRSTRCSAWRCGSRRAVAAKCSGPPAGRTSRSW